MTAIKVLCGVKVGEVLCSVKVGEVLCGVKVGEVLVVIEDLNLVLGSLQYVMPFLQTADDGK